MKKLLALMMALACLLLCACSDKQPDADELDTQVYIASTANPEEKVLMSEEDANAITAQIQEQMPDAEVVCLPGGQPIYHSIFSVE